MNSTYRVGKEGEDCELNLQGLDTCCALDFNICEGNDSDPDSDCEGDQCFHRNACEFCKEYRRKNLGHYYYPKRNR